MLQERVTSSSFRYKKCMKGLAQALMWWPSIHTEIAATVKQCESCQLHQPKPAAAPLHPWEWPREPWSHLNIDYADPLEGEMFLIVVDAHSKWIEVLRTRKQATSQVTGEKLREMFAVHGLLT